MLMEDRQKGLSSSSSNSYEVSGYKWLTAEERVKQILWAVQPNVQSECRRREITEYIQGVIKDCFGTEVVSFGSTPLKTYIPDGDVDLTVLCQPNKEDEVARGVCSLLQAASKEAFVVEDMQYVYAKVKVIKCSVNKIPVDISFNQVAGLCTFCFLEKVDQAIRRDHLFKRSIILIKTWCYYESRTLGARHGLISTYALETLVLCIINLFHPWLWGPLQVFHRFLEYYGNFDWQNYCISIYGPVPLSSVGKIREILEDEGENFLLPTEMLEDLKQSLSDPRKINEARMQEFPIRHLNVVDPLKDDNNLGCSVTSGHFMRIQSAFAQGSKQLKKILGMPNESIGEELQKKFFISTVEWNRRGISSELQSSVLAFGSGKSLPCNLTGDCEYYYRAILYAYALHDQTLHPSPQPLPPPSHVQNDTVWNPRYWSNEQVNEQVNLNAFGQKSLSPYALPYHCTSLQIASPKERGTGTYIPLPDANPYYGPWESNRRRRRHESKPRRVTMKPVQNDDQSEIISGKDSGFPLSLEQSPQIPGMQVPLPSQVDHSDKPWASFQPQVPLYGNEDPNAAFPELGSTIPVVRAPGQQAFPISQDFTPRVPVVSAPGEQVRPEFQELRSWAHVVSAPRQQVRPSVQGSTSWVPMVSAPGQQVSSGADEVRNDQLQPDDEDVLASTNEVDTEKYKLNDEEDFPLLGTKNTSKPKWPRWRPKSTK